MIQRCLFNWNGFFNLLFDFAHVDKPGLADPISLNNGFFFYLHFFDHFVNNRDFNLFRLVCHDMFNVPLKILAIKLEARACPHFIFKFLVIESLVRIRRLLSEFITMLTFSLFSIKVTVKVGLMLAKSLNSKIVVN